MLQKRSLPYRLAGPPRVHGNGSCSRAKAAPLETLTASCCYPLFRNKGRVNRLTLWFSTDRSKGSALQTESFCREFGDLSFYPWRRLLRQFELEFMQQNGLVCFRLREARHHQPATIGRG